jgi:hypothetical protein
MWRTAVGRGRIAEFSYSILVLYNALNCYSPLFLRPYQNKSYQVNNVFSYLTFNQSSSVVMSGVKNEMNFGKGLRPDQLDSDENCAGIFKQYMGARKRIGIGLSFRPARLRRLAELIPWNQFLVYLKV